MVTRCWCGTRNPYFAPVDHDCGGTGMSTCICGGDFCVCHNHGEAECDGCPDCEPELDDSDLARQADLFGEGVG